MKAKLRDCHLCLSHLRTCDNSARRRFGEEDEDVWMGMYASPFAIDTQQKLLPSKCLRRLADKTQVVTDNPNRHIRTRMTHSFEVVSIATAIANILGLNAFLCCAAALGHDIGHTPFGHVGERFLTNKTGQEFRHEVFSVVVAQHIERKCKGLNLTHQVLEAMLEHSRGQGEIHRGHGSQEATVMMYADKIGYIWADVNDIFVRMGADVKAFRELNELVQWFGPNQRARVQKCIEALCLESAVLGCVSFERSEAAKNFRRVKRLMYSMYAPQNFSDIGLLERAFDFIKRHTDADPAIVFALMSDHDILSVGGDNPPEGLTKLSIGDILPYLEGKHIDFTNSDMDW